MSRLAPSGRCTAFGGDFYSAGNPSFTPNGLRIPMTVKPGDCMIVYGPSIPTRAWAATLAAMGYGETYGSPLPADWQQLSNDGPWWKIADETDPGSMLLRHMWGMASFIAYQNAGAKMPQIVGNGIHGSQSPTPDAPVAPSVPAAATVLGIYLVNGVQGSDFPVISLPAFAEGQGYTVWPGGGYQAIGFADQVQDVAGPSVDAGSVTAASASPWGWAMTVVIFPTAASYSPTLLTPVMNGILDLALLQTFTWGYNPSLNDGPQQAYAFRRKLSAPGSSYEYWNATTSTWGAIVWNYSSANSVTFPPAKWTDNSTYNWSVATQDAVSGLQSVFAADSTVIAQQSATVVVNTPVGFTPTTAPVISWTATFPGSFVQVAVRAVVYSASQYGAVGFTPGSGPSVWDSGVVVDGSVASFVAQVPSLFNGTTLRAYVLVIETNNAASAWAYSVFQLQVSGAAVPVLVATPGTDGATGLPIISLTLDGRDSLLTADDASLEIDVGTWLAGANTVVADTTDQAADGTHSLSLTATAGGAVSASSGVYPVSH